jgi:hypothetical protein
MKLRTVLRVALAVGIFLLPGGFTVEALYFLWRRHHAAVAV